MSRHRRSVALDLGSTYIKAGLLDQAGRLGRVEALPAPALRGEGLIREGDAREYAAVADQVLDAIAKDLPPGTPLGVASQRSSFLLWDPNDGKPRTPLISWQDRRAASWCEGHDELRDEIVRRTGLVLSAHYVGPKLAAMQEQDPELAAELRGGALLWGTLDSFLLWRWSNRRVHETDLTMAARTAMMDLAHGDWSEELLEHFGVPRAILPRIVGTAGRDVELERGLTLTASVADQAAGALAVLEHGAGTALVTLGTGGFVLRSTGERLERRPGYLSAPILGRRTATRYVLEGTINGAGAALDRFPRRESPLPVEDAGPDAFCLPDVSGLGSPHWRPEIGLVLSPAAEQLDEEGRRRVTAEGLLFRIRQNLEDLFAPEAWDRIVLSGGLTADPFIVSGLAALLGRPLEILREHEGGLLGAGRLAAGLEPFDAPATTAVELPSAGTYLRNKYSRWRTWLSTLL